ncbi:hypothetical protein EX30DRAFT_167147 [Ascodesmis nigricans]|uniref:Uncharacterized protein n=1 Tax=Ascodesmis nigricans TaxID=341454 RepID=A0A4V3SHZ4_9PEZI|nr:hypothetical protein EX30DRAFT_167147 [Ascodesmis nigricans]
MLVSYFTSSTFSIHIISSGHPSTSFLQILSLHMLPSDHPITSFRHHHPSPLNPRIPHIRRERGNSSTKTPQSRNQNPANSLQKSENDNNNKQASPTSDRTCKPSTTQKQLHHKSQQT